MIEPFGEQNVFRTVSIAFSPYLPFTQAYAMKLKDTVSSVRGASTAGYFDLYPEDNAALGENEREGYPYILRRQIYQGAGEGRTAIMSTMMNREQSVVNSAKNVSTEPAANVMGAGLEQLLDSQSVALTSPALSSRYRDEIEVKMLDFLNEFTGMDEFSPTTSVPNVFRRDTHATGRSQDFDIYLENNDSFRQFIESKLPQVIANLQSAEISRETGEAASKKVLARVKDVSSDIKQATKQWTTHIKSQVLKWNARIVKDWISNGYSQSNSVASASQFELAKDMYNSGPAGSANYDLRQFINRVGRSRGMAQSVNYALEPIRHVYQVTLTPNSIGFATFYPTTTNGIPQIGFDDKNVAVVEALDGNIINAFSSWMASQNMSTSHAVAEIASLAHNEANAIAVSTVDRVERLGAYKAAQVALDFENKVQLTIRGTGGKMHLTTSEIAASLKAQVAEFYNNPQSRTNFGQWYEALFAKSNDLTKDWYGAVGMGPVGNKQGTTLSSEWQFGDQKGNPRKHYLGVWNKESEDAWKGTGSGQIGYNFSISPLVTSRREGTASFR